MPPKTCQVNVDSKSRLVITDTAGKVSLKKGVKKLVLDGVWSLTPEHDLKLHVLASESGYSGKTLIFSGDITHVGGNNLVFRIRDCASLSGMRSGTVQLKGKWQADSSNRITFNIAKARGRYDTLTFHGAWQVNKRNEVIYRYVRTHQKRKTKSVRTLTFKGQWQLGRDLIVYRLDYSKDSFFSIKATLQSRSLFAREGVIKYQVGIKYLKRKTYRIIKETIAIYGTWKLGKDFKIGFEVTYSGGRRQELEFMAEKLVAKGSTITVSLKSKEEGPIGLRVTFTKTFKDDAELFLALSRFPEESRVEGGLKVKF